MAVKLSPLFNDAQFDDLGNLLSGGKIYTYAAGTTTAQTTYTDSAGTVPQANPIILNARGEPDSLIWLTEGVAYKFVLTDDADVTIRTEDDISGVNDTTVGADQWINPVVTSLTYLSVISFSVAGDKTATFHAGRRYKATITAGTDYGRVKSSSFGGGITTVLVASDANGLDAGLSDMEVGIATATNTSLPHPNDYDALTLRNRLYNPSFGISQRGATPTSTDNAYTLDTVRMLLEAATAAAIERDTVDVPDNAKFAIKLTVGAANNNKFGIFIPFEGRDIWDLRGRTVSVRVPLKATAGLTDGTGKIRIGILEWTGTEDDIAADPVGVWDAEGTNPTLSGSWDFSNVPEAISVTTSWADYTVEAVSTGALITNLALMIWSDDKTNTTTTDILRIGGAMWFGAGNVAQSFEMRPRSIDLVQCKRFLFGMNPGTGVDVAPGYCNSTTAAIIHLPFDVQMRTAPTGVTVSNAAHFQVLDSSGAGVACATVPFSSASVHGCTLAPTVAGGLTQGHGTMLHTADASASILLTGAEL